MLDGTAVPGRRVLVLDDVNDWRGLGTAVHLAETGHEVTIATAAAVVAGGLFHSAADGPLAPALRGGRRHDRSPAPPSSTGAPGAATIRSTLTGAESVVEADALVIAETPVAETALAEALTARGIAVPPGR